MVIKDLTIAELDAFYDTFSALMREGYGQFPSDLSEYFLAHDYLKENFRLWLERGVRKILIGIDEEGQVAGFLVGDHTYGGVGFISWLGVLPEYRKQGLGGEMVRLYIDYIVSTKNAHLLELYTYDGAKPFYEKHGFVEIGRRNPGFYGQLNIIMNKPLGDWNRGFLMK